MKDNEYVKEKTREFDILIRSSPISEKSAKDFILSIIKDVQKEFGIDEKFLRLPEKVKGELALKK